jgi:D-xylose transport system permease protein
MMAEASFHPSLWERFTAWVRRAVTADFAPLPIILSLIVLAIILQAMNQNFLTAGNLSNLANQIVPTGMIACGVVLVLIIGEIDLSVGVLSGLAAAVMAVLSVRYGMPAPVAIGTALVVGMLAGLVTGYFVTQRGVPSFIVTLAGMLAWQGTMLAVLGPAGTINITNPLITGLATTFLSLPVGLGATAVVTIVNAVFLLRSERRRGAAGLGRFTPRELAVRLLAPALVMGAIVLYLGSARGVPLAFAILAGVIWILDTVTRRTRFGRHMFGIGGNQEAARRVGIKVSLTKIGDFMLGSGLAAFGGVLSAARLTTVSTSSGGGDLLLNAIAAAVIGGTSLFGGRGSVWSALLGALVIGFISNGMDLLSVPSSTKFIVTGLVLLGSVSIDAATRKRFAQVVKRAG